jgi:hypothetical protein
VICGVHVLRGDLRFDTAAHRYYIGDVEVPSVTRILKLSGTVDVGPWLTADARDRGTAFHLAAQYLDEGRLDRASVTDPIVAGRLRAYETFLVEQHVEVIELEQQVGCPRFWYAGTFDRVLRLRRTGKRYLVDFKPNPEPWHRLQLGAYARCTADAQKACLYVRADGSYSWKPYHDRPEDGQEFLRHRLAVGEKWRQAA